MITVLDIKNISSVGFVGRMSSIWKRGCVRAEIKNSGGIKVMYLSCESNCGRVDWKAVERHAGESKGYILCSRSVVLPEKMGFRRFYSKSLYRLMSINGAISVLSLLKHDCRRISLCFCDECGEYSKYAALFLPLCGSMKILSRSNVYDSFCDYAMGEYGACVDICRSARMVSDCNIFVSPRCVNLEMYCGNGAVMFTGGVKSANSRIKTINDFLWELPKKYSSLKPKNLSEEYFSQALYSIGHCRENALVEPYAFILNGRRMDAAGLAEDIIGSVLVTA